MTKMQNRSSRVVRRDLTAQNFERAQKDFRFLPKLLGSFQGELDVELRGTRMHVYHRGNRAVEVLFASDGMYTISMHKSFIPKNLSEALSKNGLKWTESKKGSYPVCKNIPKELLHPILQKAHLQAVCSRIKSIGYSEELHFEQMVIADNRDPKCFIIDRQVSGTGLKKRSMDLLALVQRKAGDYRFLVLELKMGNNPELSGAVAGQLDGYMQHVKNNMSDYQTCYTEVYNQKLALGLLGDIGAPRESIVIADEVQGAIMVAGYTGMARSAIKKLKPMLPKDVRFYQYSYGLSDKHRIR